MVKSTVVIGAIPLIGYAAGLYIPHQENSEAIKVFENMNDGLAYAQGEAASKLTHKGDHKKHPSKKGGCAGAKKAKKAKKTHHKDLNIEDFRRNDGKFKLTEDEKKSKDALSAAVMPGKVESESNNLMNSFVVTPASEDKIIPDSYIVVLKQDAGEEALATSLQYLLDNSQLQMQSYIQTGAEHSLLSTENGFNIKKVYEIGGTAFRGYAGKFLPEVAELLAQHPDVAYVEKDSIVHTMSAKEEDNAPWGLARVSHHKQLGLGTYNKYLYDNEGGEGVTSYIVDTGVYVDHKDFEGRAVWGKTIPFGDVDEDAHGHGSHCAGTIGGKAFGVAKKAKLVAVKVLGSDGSGSMSDVIGGVEYVVESHRKEQKEGDSKFKGSTANMSLGGGKSPSLDIAVNAATQAGVHFAVAAGNDNQDACYYSPASAEGAVTVGATDIRDDRAYFSNYGSCVDIFAPGVDVISVGTYSPTSSASMSGTSMASPHIAGLLTYFVSLQPGTDSEYATRGALSTKELKEHLISFGTADAIKFLDDESPNVIAYNGGGKDISDFWVGSKHEEPEHDEPKHGGLFHHVEEAYEDIVDYLEDLVGESQEVFGDLF